MRGGAWPGLDRGPWGRSSVSAAEGARVRQGEAHVNTFSLNPREGLAALPLLWGQYDIPNPSLLTTEPCWHGVPQGHPWTCPPLSARLSLASQHHPDACCRSMLVSFVWVCVTVSSLYRYF